MSAASGQVTAPPSKPVAAAAAAFKTERSHRLQYNDSKQDENEQHLSKKTRIELLGAVNDHSYNLPRRRDNQLDNDEPMLKMTAATTSAAAAVVSEQLSLDAIAANNGGDGNAGGHMDDCMAAMVLMFLSCRPGGDELGVDGSSAALVAAAETRAASTAAAGAQVAKSSSATATANADACSRRELSAKVGAKRNSEPIEMDTSSQKKLYQRHFKRRPFSDGSLCDGIVGGHEHAAPARKPTAANNCNRRGRPGLLEEEDDDDALDDDHRIELAFVESSPPKVEDEMIFELQQVDQIDEPARTETAMETLLVGLADSASAKLEEPACSQMRGNKAPTATLMATAPPKEDTEISQREKGVGVAIGAESKGDEDPFQATTTTTLTNQEQLQADKLAGPTEAQAELGGNKSGANCDSPAENTDSKGTTETSQEGKADDSHKPAAPTLVSQQQQQQQVQSAATVNFCNGKQTQPQQQQLRFRMNNPVKTRTIFSCMWPGCTKNYDSLEDIERHVRSHLGPKQCDAFGDEDFYYEETEVDEATYLAIFSRTSALPLSPSHNSDGLSSGQSFASSSPATSPVCSSGDSSSSSSSSASASSAASSAGSSSSSYHSSQLYANSIDWNHFLADHNQLLRASANVGGVGANMSGKWLPAGGSSGSNAAANGKRAQLAALTSGQHQQQQLQVYHNQQLQSGPTSVAQVGVATVGGHHHQFGGRHAGSPLVAPGSPLYNHHHHSHSHLALNGGSGNATRASIHRKLEPTSSSSNRNHQHQLSLHQQRHQRLAISSPSPPQQAGSHQHQLDSLRLVAAAGAAAAAVAAAASANGHPDSLAASSSALQFSMQLSGGSPVPSSSPLVGGARPSGALYQRRSPNNHNHLNHQQSHQKSSSSSAAGSAAAALSLSTRQPLDHRSTGAGVTRVGAKRGRKPKHSLQQQQQAEQAAGYHLGLLMQQQQQQVTTTAITSGQTTTTHQQQHTNHLKHNLSQQFFQNQSTSSEQQTSGRQQSNQSNSNNSSGDNNSGGGRGLVAAAVASLRAAQAAAAANQSSLVAAPSPSPLAVVRRTRGENRKCRKVYGMERRDLWCTQCKWKKACSRFCDP